MSKESLKELKKKAEKLTSEKVNNKELLECIKQKRAAAKERQIIKK